MGHDLIVFGEDWGRHPSSTQHLFRVLGERHRFLWINSIGLRQPTLTLRDAKRVAEKSGQVRGQNRPAMVADPKSPPTLSPPVWPMARGMIGRGFNRTVTARAIRKRAALLGLGKPILWTSLPSAVDLVGRLGERAVVYYCGDDFGALAGVDHETALAKEAELAERADLIFAASPVLAAKFPAKKTRLLSHGVDVDLFSEPVPAAPELTPSRQTAGFYGSLNEWLDQDMICAAAELLPEWDFILVGPVATDVSKLVGRANIRLLPAVSHDALPSYSQHWTASIIPFKDTPQIRACNPLKLREYLAAGRPVISTRFPAMEGYHDFVETVSTGAEMANALQALSSKPHDPVRLRAAVAGESWHRRSILLETCFDGLAA